MSESIARVERRHAVLHQAPANLATKCVQSAVQSVRDKCCWSAEQGEIQKKKCIATATRHDQHNRYFVQDGGGKTPPCGLQDAFFVLPMACNHALCTRPARVNRDRKAVYSTWHGAYEYYYGTSQIISPPPLGTPRCIYCKKCRYNTPGYLPMIFRCEAGRRCHRDDALEAPQKLG